MENNIETFTNHNNEFCMMIPLFNGVNTFLVKLENIDYFISPYEPKEDIIKQMTPSERLKLPPKMFDIHMTSNTVLRNLSVDAKFYDEFVKIYRGGGNAEKKS